MIDVLKKEDNFVAIRMSDTIAAGDHEVLVPLLESMIEEHGKVNLYCELDAIEKIDPAAVWHDLKFDARHFNDFEHVALVGSYRWIEWMATFAGPFTSAEIQCFMNSQKDVAMNWIGAKTEHAHVNRS